MKYLALLFSTILISTSCNGENQEKTVVHSEKAALHKFTNKLLNETSPYLLQHAHNPVNWYPWGQEAFDKAKKEDKPILLSVGYTACHWCHVMEHESFSDEKTAKVLNDNFVCIKVDREERPDIDRIYMNYLMLSTGSGGWPMNVFLTPDLKPFFG
ncbi:MAG: thioredoxin domain-containing protein, partial [Lentisphaeraceae bacterium]|nr:thioredoxin domain-containing protein [Lentisphaeraceae bacterium]